MMNFWDVKYAVDEFVYGTEPNLFFSEQLDLLTPGKLLLAAEGEGRNAVYAARHGWEVTAFDTNSVARQKALKMAEENGVALSYHHGNETSVPDADGTFDVLGLIYAHFSAETRTKVHRRLAAKLKSGGTVILEAFSKENIRYKQRNPRIGGPGQVETLFSEKELLVDFEGFDVLKLSCEEITLNEGNSHVGTGSVVRFVAKKNSSPNAGV